MTQPPGKMGWAWVRLTREKSCALACVWHASERLVWNMKRESVLISGASSGIGLELAREFASFGHPLILTARAGSELQSIARELERSKGRHHVGVKPVNSRNP